ncbi:MAG: DUF4173 domain-containing protein [Oscillospiraceae bacterium]|jgi:hypothetical protein|nr:DUF4173 domain-containing protein [Oscillospiraceae bacterium]
MENTELGGNLPPQTAVNPAPVQTPDTQIPAASPPNFPRGAAPRVPAPHKKYQFSTKEKLLLLVTFALAIIADRLLYLLNDGFLGQGIIWLSYIVLLYVFYWDKLKASRPQWVITVFAVALCIWHMLPDYRGYNGNGEFRYISALVIPAVLMAHAQLFGFKLKNAAATALSWLTGWIVQPFISIAKWIGAIGTSLSGGNKPVLKKVLIGLLIAIPILLVVVPLLMGADMVFRMYVQQILRNFNILDFILHAIFVITVAALVYSFMWHIGYGEPIVKLKEKEPFHIDKIIALSILGVISIVYILFCGLQFTYLFARAGLPDGLQNAAEYVHQGFAQSVAVCAINLSLFGFFLHSGEKSKAVRAICGLLLVLTAIVLTSGFVRLQLYVDVHGLTWLRLLSAWFIVYLAAAIVICAVRIFVKKLPAIGVCGLTLLGWFTAFGFMNPDYLIDFWQTHFFIG